MITQLYIGNLSPDVNQDDIKRLFSPYGDVRFVNLPRDPNNANQLRGFAYVSMGTDEAALAAISALDGTEFQGRNLKVTRTKDIADKGAFGGGGGRRSTPSGGGGYSRRY